MDPDGDLIHILFISQESDTSPLPTTHPPRHGGRLNAVAPGSQPSRDSARPSRGHPLPRRHPHYSKGGCRPRFFTRPGHPPAISPRRNRAGGHPPALPRCSLLYFTAYGMLPYNLPTSMPPISIIRQAAFRPRRERDHEHMPSPCCKKMGGPNAANRRLMGPGVDMPGPLTPSRPHRSHYGAPQGRSPL